MATADIILRLDTTQLDEIAGRITRIEENMATKAEVEQAFTDITTQVGAFAAAQRTALDNVAADVERLIVASQNPEMDVDAAATAARNSLAALRPLADQADAIAARTPEEPAPPA